jgi:hypothetical protein
LAFWRARCLTARAATEGDGRITCRFNLERDINGTAQDVREKVATAIRYQMGGSAISIGPLMKHREKTAVI